MWALASSAVKRRGCEGLEQGDWDAQVKSQIVIWYLIFFLSQIGKIVEHTPASASDHSLDLLFQDIRNQRIYRKLRKAELAKLQQTLKALNEKAAFYEEQVNYYDTYIKTCLDNLKIK